MQNRPASAFTREIGSFVEKLWRSMKTMKDDSARSGDGSLSHERSAERFRSETTWERSDGEGYPQ